MNSHIIKLSSNRHFTKIMALLIGYSTWLFVHQKCIALAQLHQPDKLYSINDY